MERSIALLIVLSLSALPAAPCSADAGTALTTVSGVYDKSQAASGRSTYRESCASCHGEALSGAGVVPALVGRAFLGRWGGRSVFDLFLKLSTTMPLGSAGKLDSTQYLDLVAFLLRANEMPASRDGHTLSLEEARTILIAPPAE